MLYSGVDLHKDNSFITVNEAGIVVKEGRIRNQNEDMNQYFKSCGSEPHRAFVEITVIPECFSLSRFIGGFPTDATLLFEEDIPNTVGTLEEGEGGFGHC